MQVDATAISIEALYRTGTRDIDLPSACIKADDVGCGRRDKSDQTDEDRCPDRTVLRAFDGGRRFYDEGRSENSTVRRIFTLMLECP